MILALGVMFVTSLLLVAAFTAANGDVHLARQDTTQKQAYYAALAGVQEYVYDLQSNPDYWETCEAPKSTVSKNRARATKSNCSLPARPRKARQNAAPPTRSPP